MLHSLVLTCFVLFRLFESDDRRFALLSPASATSISFKAAQVPVSSDNTALLLRSDQHFRRDFTFYFVSLPHFCFVVVVVVEGVGDSLSLQPWEGYLDALTVLPTRRIWKRGRSTLTESLLFRNFRLRFLCQTSTSAYQDNLTRIDDLLRLWLKTRPMMPFARVWTVNAQNRIKFILTYITINTIVPPFGHCRAFLPYEGRRDLKDHLKKNQTFASEISCSTCRTMTKDV